MKDTFISDTVSEVILDLSAADTTCAVLSEFYENQDCGNLFTALQCLIRATKSKLESVESAISK